MEIKSKTNEQNANEIILFKKVNFPLGWSDEQIKTYSKKLFIKIKDHLDLSSAFRQFLKDKLKMSGKSKDIANKFGSEWQLTITLKDHNVDVQNKKLLIAYDNFQHFLEHSLWSKKEVIQNSLNKIINNNRGINKNTKSKLANALSDDRIIEQICNSEETSKIVSSILKATNNSNIFNSAKSTQIDKIKSEATKLLSMKVSEGRWKKFLIDNKDTLFFDDKYIGDEEKISNITKDIEKKSHMDIFLINNYGAAKVVELKKSTDVILVWDNSHNIFSPSSIFAKAIAQTQNYIRIISRNENGEATKLGVKTGLEPFSSGLLIIGNQNNLYNTTETLKKKMKDNKWTTESINEKAKAGLLSISFNQKNITIVTYDQFIDSISKRG